MLVKVVFNLVNKFNFLMLVKVVCNFIEAFLDREFQIAVSYKTISLFKTGLCTVAKQLRPNLTFIVT